jgi:hypothetical protein
MIIEMDLLGIFKVESMLLICGGLSFFCSFIRHHSITTPIRQNTIPNPIRVLGPISVQNFDANPSAKTIAPLVNSVIAIPKYIIRLSFDMFFSFLYLENK